MPRTIFVDPTEDHHPLDEAGILFAPPFDNASGELRIIEMNREHRAQAP